MAALVTCKYEEYPIKNKVTIDQITFSPLLSIWELIFGIQGQITPKSIV